MKLLKSFTLLILILSASIPVPVFAGGGGRAVISVESAGVAGGKAAEIVAVISKDNEFKISADEFGLFRIANAKPGQNCITKNQRSNADGKIYGSCSSPVSGEMEVYIHFPDKVEDGQPYKVTILPKGTAPTQLVNVSPESMGPCGSGLTSYGWDPSNGKACPQDHYDSWTAFCGNGYQQDVKIGNCIHANELSNHSEWREVAAGICSNPRCDMPKPKVVSSPRPTSTTSTPSAKPLATPIETSKEFATASAVQEQTVEKASNSAFTQEKPTVLQRLLRIWKNLFARM